MTKMVSYQRKCWLAGFLITFGMLVGLRGMGLRPLMDPHDVRYLLATLTSLGIAAVIVFFAFLKHYSSHEPPEGTGQGQGQDQGEGSAAAEELGANGSIQEAAPLLPSPSSSNPHYGAVSPPPPPPPPPSPPRPSRISVQLGTNRRDSRTLSYFLAQHSHTMAIYIFGGGSVVLNLFKVFYTAQCLPFFHQSGLGATEQDEFTYADQQSRIVSAMLKIIFFSIEIPLLHCLSSVKSVRCRTLSRYILLPIMGANFSAWLYTFLDETKVIALFNYSYPSEAYLYDIGTACRNHSSVVEIYIRGSMLRIFYPISMEFCIVSFEVLHHVYMAPVFDPMTSSPPPPPDAHAYSTQQQDDVIASAQAFAQTPGKLRVTAFHENVLEDAGEMSEDSLEIALIVSRQSTERREANWWQKILRYVLMLFHPCTALILGITEASLIKISVLHSEAIDHHYITDHYLHTVCQIPVILFRVFCNAVPLLCATIFCFLTILSFKHQRRARGVNWSLLLGLLGICVISIYTIAICFLKFKTLSDDDDRADRELMYALSLVEWLLYIPQYFLQVFLIYHGQRRIAEPGHPLFESLHQCLSYMALNNFIHWGINSFLEADYLKHRNDLAQQVTAWDFLVHLMLPTCIYFRYISTFLLLEIQHLLKAQQGTDQEWRIVVAKQQ